MVVADVPPAWVNRSCVTVKFISRGPGADLMILPVCSAAHYLCK